MKIATILGTRPEIIRLSLIIAGLDKHCEHCLIHTGQNHDERLSDIFFEELGVRTPDIHLGVQANSFGEQAGLILQGTEEVLRRNRPDRLLILGDTNSALSAIVAKRMGIPVFHMEAGNRCRDDRVPEEVNRRIVDQCSDLLMAYTERSRQNLLREGFPEERIFVTGNPIFEVLQTHQAKTEQSDILQQLDLEENAYFLVSLHRAENLEPIERLSGLLQGLQELVKKHDLPVIMSTHPRLRNQLARLDSKFHEKLRLLPPFGLFDFLRLQKSARCVLSDSGTVQEECAILGAPNVTLRDVTERPETLECGSNILAGGGSASLSRAVNLVLDQTPAWQVPSEYLKANVSQTVLRLLLGFHQGLSS